MSVIVTFGEVMGRLNPPAFGRLRQNLPGALHLTFAGAEANVAVSLALLGEAARFVTAVPRNPLGAACLDCLRGRGVDTQYALQRDEGRLGLYFVETGANQRPSQVVYDRSGSTISLTEPTEYAWDSILSDAKWLHVTGITPAISALAAQGTLNAVRAAKERDVAVSCDLNFRKKLWRWNEGLSPQKLAEKTMREVLPFVDLVIANEADCHDVLGIAAEGSDTEAGQLDVSRYPAVAKQLTQQFPNVSHVAITLRESFSASHNDWGGMLYLRDEQHAYFAPLANGQYTPYPIRNIVDRVGAGDAFAAGLIFAMNCSELNRPADAVRFAVASSCLAHSIEGDFNFSTRQEVEALMGGATSGRVIR